MTELIASLPPGLLLIVGALLFPLVRHRAQQVWLILLPILSAAHLMFMPPGAIVQAQLFDYTLTPVRIDELSMVWGVIFHIAALVSGIYALHVRDATQHAAGMAYAGAAIAAVFAGDLITLFVFWELTALTSVFLIWAQRTDRAYRTGMRYLLIQVTSGVVLMAGVLLHVAGGGSIDFGVGALGADMVGVLMRGNTAGDIFAAPLGVQVILLGIGVKAAFPLLHNWVQDAYPQATPSGAVFLSAFTTKLAIYALARGFAGTEALVWIGLTMVAFPVFYAAIVNDLRRVLAYSLNNQLGYMVCGIGMANFALHPDTAQLALNGAAAHAFAHILYKGLLFMSMGAVLHRLGTCKASDLGGLYKSMPWTAWFCMIGVASIAAFPLFSGFVTKSMIFTAAAEQHRAVVFLVMLSAFAAMFHNADLKVPFFAFFNRDPAAPPKRCEEAPLNMLIAMGITAALCIGVGVYYSPLYALLPFQGDKLTYFGDHVYGFAHVLTQVQLLMFTALSFTLLVRARLYPAQLRSVQLDTDWTYRRALPFVTRHVRHYGGMSWDAFLLLLRRQIDGALYVVRRLCTPHAIFARTWTTSGMVIWATILLGAYLLLYYIRVKP